MLDNALIIYILLYITKGSTVKYYISKETNSVYWIDASDFEFKTLMFANIKGDNTFDPVYDGGEVDENLIGDEYIDENHLKTFSELYSDIRKALA